MRSNRHKTGPMALTNSSGDIYRGRDAVDVVVQMRDASFTDRDKTVPMFMRQVAGRVELMYGKTIRATSEQRFIEDLLAIGHLSVLDEK